MEPVPRSLPPVRVIAPTIKFRDSGLVLQNAFVSFRTYPAALDLQVVEGKLAAHSVLGVWASSQTYLDGLEPVAVADCYFAVDDRLVEQLRASASAQLSSFDLSTIEFGFPQRNANLNLVTQVVPLPPSF